MSPLSVTKSHNNTLEKDTTINTNEQELDIIYFNVQQS